MERDANLDKYRAIVMAYIVCIIHLIYWAGFCSEPDRSFLLFEMPVIFFISGASYRLSTPKSYTYDVLLFLIISGCYYPCHCQSYCYSLEDGVLTQD